MSNFIGHRGTAFLVMPYFIGANGGIWLLSTLGRLWLYAQLEWAFGGKAEANLTCLSRDGFVCHDLARDAGAVTDLSFHIGITKMQLTVTIRTQSERILNGIVSALRQ